MKLAVLSSGGDAPGMNAAIRTVVKVGLARGHSVVGVRDGYAGLMEGAFRPLALEEVDGLSGRGGTCLGSARSARFHEAEGRARAAEALAAAGVSGLVVIGGNGSLTGAHHLAREAPVKVVGVPASIDNDIGHTRLAIGVDTAVNTIVEACDRIIDTASAHRRAFVVEVMGRDSGFLAMRAGLAAEADAILYAEKKESEDELVERLRGVLRHTFRPGRGKRWCLIVKAEGVKVPTPRLVERLRAQIEEDAPGVEVREVVLGHVVRGGRPSQTDRVIAQRLAFAAVLALEAGMSDRMAAWECPAEVGHPTEDPRVRLVPLAEVLEETRRLLDGTSPVVAARKALLSAAEPILAL
ncbi:MAG: ATP-dependent 6-phosphofructokinase [Deltaproteobacteria bacterium]|nr:MAG: ATP-dependent 6-phosphofructokinase [Deltaproteobacteria bacterium]